MSGDCTPYWCTFKHPTERDLELMRNQAAIRVRARRRIRRALGPVYVPSSGLPALLKTVIELERSGWRRTP